MNEELEKVEESSDGLTDEQVESLNELIPSPEPVADNPVVDNTAATVQMVEMLVSGVFAVLAARLGSHWALKPAESKAIAEPAVMVLDKYFPDMNIGPELALAGAVAMVVLPRAMTQIDIEKKKGEAIDGDQSKPVSTE